MMENSSIPLRPILNIAVSGHTRIRERLRALGTEEAIQKALHDILADCREILRKQRADFENLYDDSKPTIRILSCMAKGTDEVASKEALYIQQQWDDINVELHGLCPTSDTQEMSSVVAQLPPEQLFFINAEKSTCTTKDYDYLHANKVMLAQADFLIAVWDGKQDNHIGGTYSLILRAKESGVPIILLEDKDELRRYYIWHNSKQEYSTDSLGTTIHNILVANKQSATFQEIYKQDEQKAQQRIPKRIVEDLLMPSCLRLFQFNIVQKLASLLCTIGNRNVQYRISPEETKALHDTTQNFAESPLEAIYQKFDYLSRIAAAKHRNSMIIRLLYSLIAVIFLVLGVSMKTNDAPSIAQVWQQCSAGEACFYGGCLLILIFCCFYGIGTCLFCYKSRTITDKLWKWSCLLLIVCSAWYCISGDFIITSLFRIFSGSSDTNLLMQQIYTVGGGKVYMWLIFLQNIFLFAIVSITIQNRDANELVRFSYYRSIAERSRLGKYTWIFGACTERTRERVYLEKTSDWSSWYFRNILRNLGLPHGHITRNELVDGLVKTSKHLAEEQCRYHAARYHKNTTLGAALFSLIVVCFIAWMSVSYLRLFSINTNDWVTAINGNKTSSVLLQIKWYTILSGCAMLLPGIISFCAAFISSMELFSFSQVSRQMYLKLCEIKMRADSMCQMSDSTDDVLSTLSFDNVWNISQDINHLYTEELADWQHSIGGKKIKVIN